MRKSILFRRIILLLLSAVILSGALSAVIYVFITHKMYVEKRADELTPIARTIAAMMSDAQKNGNTDRGEWRLLERENKDFLGALLNVYNSEGKSIMNPLHNEGKERNKNRHSNEDDLTPVVTSALEDILSGEEISDIHAGAGGQSYLAVGVPIKDGGEVSGAVIFTNSIGELSESRHDMNMALLVSTCIAFLIMLIPAYLLARRLVVPIRQMENVAQAMSNGEFSLRADETQSGEIGELARAMNHFAEESGQLEQTRRDYVANISHELRTPIASIRAMGETLRDGLAATEEKQTLFYNNIVRESMRLSRLVDDMLELSRLQSSDEPLKKTQFDLRDVMQNVADIYSHVVAEAGCRFHFDMDMDNSMIVFSNPDRIEQVLIILLDNAVKFTPEDGAVRLSVIESGENVEVCISDTGGGIPAEDIPHIFERFYKADESHSGVGTGLGLSIANEIIKGLGETIRVESNRDGTAFTLTVHRECEDSR